jgi:CheY-like chemotaxis protein
MESSREKPLILAFDEMKVMLETINEMLTDNYDVIGVTSFTGILKEVAKHAPALFLLDTEMSKPSFYAAMKMEIASGFDIAKVIRSMSNFSKTQILFMAATVTAKTIANAIKSGGGGVIVKPPSKVVLLGKINYLLSPVTVTVEQTERLLHLSAHLKFSQIGFSMMLMRMKTLYAKYPTKETLQTFAEEITAFIEKSKIVMAADYEIISKL